MLLSLTIENWGPFKDATEFWMIPFPKLAQHKGRPVPLSKYRMKVLPIAALFGANASGKTNLFSAVEFARDFVLNGLLLSGRIQRRPYVFEDAYAVKPTRFEWNFFAGGSLYDYVFSVSDERVTYERLTKILTKTEEILFERNDQTFTGKLFTNADARDSAYSTPGHVLFLSKLIDERFDGVQGIERFFRSIRVIGSDLQNKALAVREPHSQLAYGLRQLQTGIHELSSAPAYLDTLERGARESLLELLYRHPGKKFEISAADHTRLIGRFDAAAHHIIVEKRLLEHRTDHGRRLLSPQEESSGTRRLLSLLPQLQQLVSNPEPGIVFIDDLDEGLHPLLAKKILIDFMSLLDGSKQSQLIFSCRSTELLDQELFRRDEIWLSDRNADNSSCSLRPLTSFVDENGKYIRFDKVIRRDYLNGVYGGIPRFSKDNVFVRPQE